MPSDDSQPMVPPRERILAKLKSEHPRVILDASAQRRLRTTVGSSEETRNWSQAILNEANLLLDRPPAHFEIPDGKRLLAVSREVKERVQHLFLALLLDGGDRYLERLWRELDNAAGFENWNPSHFLDTAELTYAFAAAYDWLYQRWTEAQRDRIRHAIVELGLKPAIEVFDSDVGFHRKTNNWNQVCNGGIGLGALAIADEEHELASSILHQSITNIPISLRMYGPDGAGREGATYWDYGTRYAALFLCGLETALGTDFGLSNIRGFGESGSYQIYMAGAGGMAFNFGDCGMRRMSTPQHLWFGRRFGKPQFSWFRLSELKRGTSPGTFLDLLWLDPSEKDYAVRDLPLSRYFRGAECVSMRSAWGDPNALVVGFQGGNNNNLEAHRHLDLGSFILEEGGVRWVIDPGGEKQTYQVHRHPYRKWEFYRIRAEGHNTLVINPDGGPDQNVDAEARMVKFETDNGRAVTTVDLSDAYAPHARRIERTIEMVQGRRVTVTDEVDLQRPGEIWWFMHTEATVELNVDHTVATLSQNGRSFFASIVGPEGAQFAVLPALPLSTAPNPPNQADNADIQKLGIHLEGVRQVRLVVELSNRFPG